MKRYNRYKLHSFGVAHLHCQGHFLLSIQPYHVFLHVCTLNDLVSHTINKTKSDKNTIKRDLHDEQLFVMNVIHDDTSIKDTQKFQNGIEFTK